MNDLHDTIVIILLVALITIPSTLNMLKARTTYPLDGVKTLSLVAGCELDIYDKTVQPVRTVALACPRVDYIRLWPLPMEQPWDEDKWKDISGENTLWMYPMNDIFLEG